MTRFAAAMALAALLAAGCGTARAQGLDMSKGGPVEVTSRDGIEWRQHEQVVIARGDARAVRGDVTVVADTLIAHYRKKPSATAAVATPASAPSGAPGLLGGADDGSNEIYRLEADGHVKIFNQTDIAVGDHAIYDIDQAVMVMTGAAMSLTTPTDVMTARDTMEYWSQKHMAVGRGLASVTTSDGRRLAADVIVGYTTQAATATATPAAAGDAKPAQPGHDPIATGGKLQRVEAFGHVDARTATETITGERGVYVADTGIARIVGHVEVTRGQNHAVGDEALVNMNTGVYTLVRLPGHRVEGVIVPGENATPGGAAAPSAPAGPAPTKRKPAAR